MTMADILKGGFLAGKKTYILAAVTVIGAVANYLVGDADLMATLQLIVTGGIGATLRAGIASQTPQQ